MFLRTLIGCSLLVGFAGYSFAVPELMLTSGLTTTTVVPSSGTTVSYTNPNFNGWNIEVVFGASNSPNLSGANGPFGLDLTSLTATCNGGASGCASNPLDIKLSDIGFTQPAPGLTTGYSVTQSGSGSSVQNSYFSTANTYFTESTLIGTVGSFSGTNSGTKSGPGPGSTTPYSLTIDDMFTDNGSAVSFSSDGNIYVPEPASIALLATVLLVTGSLLRRRLESKRS